MRWVGSTLLIWWMCFRMTRWEMSGKGRPKKHLYCIQDNLFVWWTANCVVIKSKRSFIIETLSEWENIRIISKTIEMQIFSQRRGEFTEFANYILTIIIPFIFWITFWRNSYYYLHSVCWLLTSLFNRTTFQSA